MNGRRYDSKAIAGAAHHYAVPTAGPLKPADFSGGEASVGRVLERLGFTVEGPSQSTAVVPSLDVGRVYTWNELGTAFGFAPSLFQVGGGMLSRPEQNALLLITHPGGARSFDYEDRWEGDTLVYTGRGKKGDQRLEGPNRDVAENRKRLLVLEAVASRQLRYLGEATCVDSWPARSPDSEGHERNVWKFRLRFDAAAVASATAIPPNENERSCVDLDPSSQAFLLRGRQPDARLERRQRRLLFFRESQPRALPAVDAAR